MPMLQWCALPKTCNYHIWVLRHIRQLLSLDVARTLACSIVVDYCNFALYGAPTSSIQKLQRVQNSLAGVMLKQPRMSRARTLLKSLHWLPVYQRIKFKVAVVTYKIYAELLIRRICTRCCQTASVNPRRHRGRHRDQCYTCLELELSMAVAPSVSLRQHYGTVCLPTSQTLHHQLSLETVSKHSYFIKPSWLPAD